MIVVRVSRILLVISRKFYPSIDHSMWVTQKIYELFTVDFNLEFDGVLRKDPERTE